MQIVYLNVNRFCGSTGWKKNYDSREENADAILNWIFEERKLNPDILFFAEFDWGSSAGKECVSNLKKRKYYGVYACGGKYKNRTLPSQVAGFAKKEMKSEGSPAEWLKWNEIMLDNYRIVGVHIPCERDEKPEEDFWNNIVEHYEKHLDESVIYIGDMNVYAKDTDRMLMFEKMNKRDAWIEAGNGNDNQADATYIDERGNLRRLDYVLISQGVPTDFIIKNEQSVLSDKLSDHSALVFEC